MTPGCPTTDRFSLPLLCSERRGSSGIATRPCLSTVMSEGVIVKLSNNTVPASAPTLLG